MAKFVPKIGDAPAGTPEIRFTLDVSDGDLNILANGQIVAWISSNTGKLYVMQSLVTKGGNGKPITFDISKIGG